MACVRIILSLGLLYLAGQTVGLRCRMSKSELRVGDNVTFYCITDFKVSSKSTKLVLKYGDTTEQRQIQTSSNFSLTTTLQANDNYQKFVCKERNRHELLDSCFLIPLTIPTVVSIRSHQNVISEGDTVAYSCSSEAQPTAVPDNYKWYLRGSQVTADSAPKIQLVQDGLKIKIFNVSISDDNSEVKCEVINSVGANGTASMKLKIIKRANKAPPTTSTILKNSFSLDTNKTINPTKPDATPDSITEASDVFVTDELFSTVLILEQSNPDTIIASNLKVWYYNVIEGTAIGGFVLLVILIMFTSCLIGLVIRKSKTNTDWKEEQEREKRKLKRLSIIPDETRVDMTANNAYVSPTKTEEGDTVGDINNTTRNYNFDNYSPKNYVSNRSASLPLTTLTSQYDDSSHQDYVNTFPRHHDDTGYVNAPGTSGTPNIFNFDQSQVNAYLNEEYNRLSELYENEHSLNDLLMQLNTTTT